MSDSRPVKKLRVIMVDRRVLNRAFGLRPDADRGSQRLFLYLLGVFADRHGMRLHTVIQMSNHYHVVMTDEYGNGPDFYRDFHATLALAMSAHRGDEWDGPLWDKKQTSVVELLTPGAIIKQCAYVITNGVAAGIVSDPRKFPGAIVLAKDIGRLVTTIAFPKDNDYLLGGGWPEKVTLRWEVPEPLLEAYGAQGSRDAIQQAVDERVRELVAARRALGLGFGGAEAMCTAPIATVGTKRELGGKPPEFAVGKGESAVLREAVRARAAWRIAYRACWDAWVLGDVEVVWPVDTWKMHRRHRRPRVPS